MVPKRFVLLSVCLSPSPYSSLPPYPSSSRSLPPPSVREKSNCFVKVSRQTLFPRLPAFALRRDFHAGTDGGGDWNRVSALLSVSALFVLSTCVYIYVCVYFSYGLSSLRFFILMCLLSHSRKNIHSVAHICSVSYRIGPH